MATRQNDGDGLQRRRKSIMSTSGSREIDWIADEHDELQISSELTAQELEKQVDCLPHQTLKRKYTWSEEEDEMLIQVVNLECSRNWSTIARSIPGRSRKQCRDRWTCYLDPAVNKEPWSEQEDMTLIHAHQIHGNKWSKLAKLLPGRTGKAVKNYWTGPMKKKVKAYLARGMPEQSSMPNDTLIVKNRGSSTIKSDQDSNIKDSPNCVNTDSPAHDFQSSKVHSDEICSSADSEPPGLDLSNITDLLDMPYCESLMIIPPGSPHDGNSIHGI